MQGAVLVHVYIHEIVEVVLEIAFKLKIDTGRYRDRDVPNMLGTVGNNSMRSNTDE